jgi:hypothetical protein
MGEFRPRAVEQIAVALVWAAAGEKAAGFRYNPVTEKGDMSRLTELFAPEDVAAARASGLAEANRLLTGELAGKHQQLTEVFREQFGKTLKFEDFKHILGTIGISVAAPQLAQLFMNYQGKKAK